MPLNPEHVIPLEPGALSALATGDAHVFAPGQDFEVVPAGTMSALAQAAEGALDPALRHRLLALIPRKYGGNG